MKTNKPKAPTGNLFIVGSRRSDEFEDGSHEKTYPGSTAVLDQWIIPLLAQDFLRRQKTVQHVAADQTRKKASRRRTGTVDSGITAALQERTTEPVGSTFPKEIA